MQTTNQGSPLTQYNEQYYQNLLYTSKASAEAYRVSVTAPRPDAQRVGNAPLNTEELELVANGTTWQEIQELRKQPKEEIVQKQPKEEIVPAKKAK